MKKNEPIKVPSKSTLLKQKRELLRSGIANASTQVTLAGTDKLQVDRWTAILKRLEADLAKLKEN